MPNTWFIRHGESESNAGLATSNPATIPLTPKGKTQAQQIVAQIKQTPTLIVTSPYLRTQQTAQPTLDKFSQVPHETWPIQEFTYLAPARCQQTTNAERRPWVEAYWQQADPFYVDGVDAESCGMLIERVNTTFDRLENYPSDAFIILFCHGHFMKAAKWWRQTLQSELTSAKVKEFWSFASTFEISNGTIFKDIF
ncbi:MAG: histidine phosphatase family protein [Chloroflexota bacterium]